jgi:uncharacterized protein (DUF2249 family)
MSATAATTSTQSDLAGGSSNARVIETIRAHHSQLAADLRDRTAALLADARLGDCGTARLALHDWYRAELIPHAVAEEQTLYRAAGELDATRLLVQGMLAEHRALISLIADLALAREPFETALAAASAEALFGVHLDKENELLLPALDRAGVGLGELLDGLHEIIGAEPAGGHDGCGCGCAHPSGEPGGAPTLVQLTSNPDRPPAAAMAPAAADPAELDVRTLPHGQRHEIIFGRLDALAAGEELVIVNDHDPKPLRYQTEALWPHRFEWAYREAGPQVWRVAITRAD